MFDDSYAFNTSSFFKAVPFSFQSETTMVLNWADSHSFRFFPSMAINHRRLNLVSSCCGFATPSSELTSIEVTSQVAAARAQARPVGSTPNVGLPLTYSYK